MLKLTALVEATEDMCAQENEIMKLHSSKRINLFKLIRPRGAVDG